MLEVKNISKSFKTLQALNNVSFDVDSGRILGLIGPNGSGKTTLFWIVLNFLSSDGEGKVLWKNQAVAHQLHDVIGYLPEEQGLYVNLTIEQQVLYFAQLRGMNRKDILLKLDEWMGRLKVKGKVKDKIKTLSKGNQQKVN